MLLSDLPSGRAATIERVEGKAAVDTIAARLRDLGFVSGEPVRVVARGLIGADPLVVQIGFTRFALRRTEAARVIVQLEAA
ncbi:MAG TPA: FeoA family protein [Spongiibacteraceae bacterium]|jgi:ferrous iron transport protein A